MIIIKITYLYRLSKKISSDLSIAAVRCHHTWLVEPVPPPFVHVAPSALRCGAITSNEGGAERSAALRDVTQRYRTEHNVT